MPNRIIKESICTSEKISTLTDFEFRLWVALITQADDLGRGDARPAIIKGRAFPLRERVTSKDIDAAVHSLAAKGCVSLYTVGGKPYFWFPTWGEHQRVRDVKPKFPGPEEADNSLPQSAAGCGKLPPEYQSNPNPNTNPEYKDSAEQQAPTPPPVISLPLHDGTEFLVSQEQCQEWAGLYPAVDVMQQLREMRAWLDANPKRRKTKSGIKGFIVRWLGKEQDAGRGRRNLPPVSGPTAPDPRAAEDMARMRRMLQKMHEEEGT